MQQVKALAEITGVQGASFFRAEYQIKIVILSCLEELILCLGFLQFFQNLQQWSAGRNLPAVFVCFGRLEAVSLAGDIL